MMLNKFEELLNIDIEESGSAPIYQQVYQAVVEQIIAKRLTAGSRLPASRVLAKQLSVSRNTIQTAYDQLIAEGYLEARAGSGVYVCADIPDDYCAVHLNKQSHANQFMQISMRKAGDFSPGVPDLKHFPQQQWLRSVNKALRMHYQQMLYTPEWGGVAIFKKTLADYMHYARGVRCVPEQIIITSGAQEAISIVMRALLTGCKTIAIENPGYVSAYEVATSCQANIIPIPIESNGIDVHVLQQQKDAIQLLYVTPSHQYPLGAALSVNKRLALIQWAEDNDAYIIEDDYDSEYHYKTKPLPSMQSLDHYNRVIYVGTFSKVLFPGLRLGFLVVPPALVEKLQQYKKCSSGPTALMYQYALNTFMQDGYFNRHVKSMRLHYAKKLKMLVALCKKYLPKDVSILAHEIGLHITLIFAKESQQEKALQLLAEHGFYPSPLSQYYYGKKKQYGLVIGFANTSEEKLAQGVQLLRKVLINA